MTDFNIGDRVWDERYGIGTIDEVLNETGVQFIEKSNEWPIGVRFDNGSYEYYVIDGPYGGYEDISMLWNLQGDPQ
jgi:hypothetical protein